MTMTTNINESIPLLFAWSIAFLMLSPCWVEFWKRFRQTVFTRGPEGEEADSKCFGPSPQEEKQKKKSINEYLDHLNKHEAPLTMADVWVELPVTMVVSMCISSAVRLVDSAVRNTAQTIGLPR